MIYVVLDTNIWIYLANGFYIEEKKGTDEYLFSEEHFDLLKILKDKVEYQEFTILINSQILEEWENNKSETEDLIRLLKKRKKDFDNYQGEIIKFIEDIDYPTLGKLIKKAKSKIDNAIAKNRNHIKDIEYFLKNNCEEIPISETLKSEVFNMALKKKKAPFLNSKNNLADALILFSSIEFLKEKLIPDISNAIFISYNHTEYATNDDKDEFHPDIKRRIGKLDLTYVRDLNQAVPISEEMQASIAAFHEYREAILDEISFSCMSPFCDSETDINSFGYLDSTVRVKSVLEDEEDPFQLKLFELPELQDTEEFKIKKVKTGKCLYCGTLHLECPDCESLMIELDDAMVEGIYCKECDVMFEIDFSSRNNDKIIKKGELPW